MEQSGVSLVWATPNADAMIADMARVSAPANVGKDATGLIAYLIRRKEWSPFEMADVCLSIRTTRDITRQILRHRSFKFQEFCVAGNTVVTFEVPSVAAKGRRMATKQTIETLYRSFKAGRKLPSMIRVFDEESRQFTTSRVRAVFQTGVKPTFLVTLENGRSIECTKEHKFLTDAGFVPLEDAIGLEVINGRAVMTKPETALACNGTVGYADLEWLSAAKARSIQTKMGLAGIAAEAGCTIHTVRKWLKRHGLQFTKSEVATYRPTWNKGKSGYSLPRHRMETIEKMRRSAKRGPASNLWRGGADRRERLKIADWCDARRSEFLKSAEYRCAECGKLGGKLELHHKEPVALRPDLAREPSNIAVVCGDCHRGIHNLRGDYKTWRDRSQGHTLTVRWSKVRSIEFVGEQMTYDLEVEHGSHNYVGNGIVVHNSQRYATVDVLPPAPLREARMQDTKNRQSSLPCADADLVGWWQEQQQLVRDVTDSVYREALEKGLAKEQARAVLPEGLTPSHLYMKGEIRNWMHYCALRSGNGTQKEHQVIAEAAWVVLRQVVPACVAAWEAVNG